MDRDKTNKVTFGEYWKFVQDYLKFKGVKESDIKSNQKYFQKQFAEISEKKWFFTEEQAIKRARSFLN